MAVLVVGLSGADPYVGVGGQVSINDKLYRSTSRPPNGSIAKSDCKLDCRYVLPELTKPLFKMEMGILS